MGPSVRSWVEVLAELDARTGLRLSRAGAFASAIALVAALGCSSGNDNVPSYASDGAYDVPTRVVTGDLPDGFLNGVEAGTGTVGAPPIGPVDAVVSHDSPIAGADAAVLDASGDANGACDLVMQNCARGFGCYPRTTGTGQCLPEGVLNQGAFCVSSDQCAAGLLCVDNQNAGVQLCAPICDSGSITPCPGSGLCSAYPGSNVGTCTF